jgi:hypothetical protein
MEPLDSSYVVVPSAPSLENLYPEVPNSELQIQANFPQEISGLPILPAPALPPSKRRGWTRLNPYLHLLSLRGWFGFVDSPAQFSLFSGTALASWFVGKRSLKSILEWQRDGTWRVSLNFADRTARILALVTSVWVGISSLRIVAGQLYTWLVTRKMLYAHVLEKLPKIEKEQVKILDLGCANRGIFSTLAMLSPPAADDSHVQVWAVGETERDAVFKNMIENGISPDSLSDLPQDLALQFIMPTNHIIPGQMDQLASPTTLTNKTRADELTHRLPLPRLMNTGEVIAFDAIVVTSRFETLVGSDDDPASAVFERRAILRELHSSLADDGWLILWGWDDVATSEFGNSSLADLISTDLVNTCGYSESKILMRLGRVQDEIDGYRVDVSNVERLGVGRVVRMGGGYPVWIILGKK